VKDQRAHTPSSRPGIFTDDDGTTLSLPPYNYYYNPRGRVVSPPGVKKREPVQSPPPMSIYILYIYIYMYKLNDGIYDRVCVCVREHIFRQSSLTPSGCTCR